MTAKEYLEQARTLDQVINTKLRQVEQLRTLTRQLNAAVDSEPVAHSRNTSKMQETIAKLIDAENELNADIDRFVDLKVDISLVIRSVPDPTQRLILEKRYLCFESWERIAEELFYVKRAILKLHAKALEAVERIRKETGSDV